MLLNAGLIHALPPSERRVLNRAEAASYAGVSTGHFDKLVAAGTMPVSLSNYGQTRRWDRAAIDVALDLASGINSSSTSAVVSAYDTWSTTRGQG